MVGEAAAKLSFSGFYDPGMTTFSDYLLSLGSINLTYCPGGGSTIGDGARLGKVLVTSYAESSPVGGIVAVKGAFDALSNVGFGMVLHPMSEDTNTTTGATWDDGAATATGWSASLHVGLVDGGSWVIKLQDSSNLSDWADLANGTLTGLTPGHAHYDTPTAVRRYVRYIATRTGGAGGDGITFAISFSRN